MIEILDVSFENLISARIEKTLPCISIIFSQHPSVIMKLIISVPGIDPSY